MVWCSQLPSIRSRKKHWPAHKIDSTNTSNKASSHTLISWPKCQKLLKLNTKPNRPLQLYSKPTLSSDRCTSNAKTPLTLLSHINLRLLMVRPFNATDPELTASHHRTNFPKFYCSYSPCSASTAIQSSPARVRPRKSHSRHAASAFQPPNAHPSEERPRKGGPGTATGH